MNLKTKNEIGSLEVSSQFLQLLGLDTKGKEKDHYINLGSSHISKTATPLITVKVNSLKKASPGAVDSAAYLNWNS